MQESLSRYTEEKKRIIVLFTRLKINNLYTLEYTILPGIPVILIDLNTRWSLLLKMKLHLPNSVWIGNIDTFLKKWIRQMEN